VKDGSCVGKKTASKNCSCAHRGMLVWKYARKLVDSPWYEALSVFPVCSFRYQDGFVQDVVLEQGR
jgi:hypothetical protein